MKAVVQTYRTGELSVIDSPVPELRPSGVLVQTLYSVLSAGTERAKIDLARKSLLGKARARPEAVKQVLRNLRENGLMETWQKVQGKLNQYSPLGYSSAGRVLAVGSDVAHLRIGDRVACAGAGFANHAEVAFIPKNLCVPIPDSVSTEAAAFTTLGTIALQGVRQAEAGVRDRVLVVGLGLIGLLAVQILKANGCAVAGVDMDERRVRLAIELGADLAITRGASDLEAVLRGFAARGFDLALLTAATKSNDPIVLAGEMLRDRGRVIVLGDISMSVPRSPYYEKELDLRLARSYGPGRYDPVYEEQGVDYPYAYVRWTEQRNMQAFLELLVSEEVRVEPLITHRFQIEQAEAAYQVLGGQSKEPFLGVVLQYAESSSSSEQIVPTPPQYSPQPRDTIRVGLIGAGNFVRGTLVPTLKGLASFEMVAAASGISAASLAKDLRAKASTVEEILASPVVNLAVIGTRHDTHCQLAGRALQARKAVFLEKPLAISEEQLTTLEQIYNDEEQAGHHPFLMVGFNRRFSPHVVRVREVMDRRSEPAMLVYRTNGGFIPRSHWTQGPEGGGRIIGEVCHFLDLLQYLCCSRVEEMSALALRDCERYAGDNVGVLMRLSDGSVATMLFCATGDKTTGKERIEVFWEGTTVLLDDFKHLTISRDGRRKTWSTTSVAKGHAEEMRALAAALTDGKPSPVAFDDARAVTRATFQIVRLMQGVTG